MSKSISEEVVGDVPDFGTFSIFSDAAKDLAICKVFFALEITDRHLRRKALAVCHMYPVNQASRRLQMAGERRKYEE